MLLDVAGIGSAEFSELIGAADRLVRDQVGRVLGSHAQAPDVVQEVFLGLWLHAGRFDPAKGSASAWVATVARRRAIDHLRHLEVERTRDQRLADLSVDLSTDVVWERVAGATEVAELPAGLRGLSQKQREAVSLAFVQGHTHVQIAALVELPLVTVKARIRDGLLRLRAILDNAERDDVEGSPHASYRTRLG